MRTTASKQLLSPRFKFDATSPYKPAVSETQRSLINLVKSKLDSGDYSLKSCSCPCGADGADDVVIAEVDRYGLPFNSVLCGSCGTVRIDPYLNDESIADFYTHTYRRMYGLEVDIEGSYDSYIATQSSYAKKLIHTTSAFITSESRICEVGCGAGGGVKFWQEQGYDAVGCDYDVSALEAGRKHGVKHLYDGNLDSLKEGLGEAKFDLIYLHHVFEHLDDPVQFLQDSREFLTPQGRLIVIVPDISRIDQFGHLPSVGNLLMYLHVAHKYNFTVEGIKRLSQRADYSATKLEPDESMKTPWSESPELWVQIMPNAETEANGNNATKPVSKATGLEMLKYLQRTEKLYSLGLCQGQLAHKFSTLRSPKKIASKVKRMLSAK
ncbi:MAG: class I SAM-dependent methyltransferase [Leptolyngbya sp. SIO1D8]|nr:class I SAM-dependent methyltransferase [Leptolyngbya sp. SIO1D8]